MPDLVFCIPRGDYVLHSQNWGFGVLTFNIMSPKEIQKFSLGDSFHSARQNWLCKAKLKITIEIQLCLVEGVLIF